MSVRFLLIIQSFIVSRRSSFCLLLLGYMQCSGDARRIRKRLSNLPYYVLGSKLACRCHGNVIRAEFVDARYTIHKYSVCNVAGFKAM